MWFSAPPLPSSITLRPDEALVVTVSIIDNGHSSFGLSHPSHSPPAGTLDIQAWTNALSSSNALDRPWAAVSLPQVAASNDCPLLGKLQDSQAVRLFSGSIQPSDRTITRYELTLRAVWTMPDGSSEIQWLSPGNNLVVSLAGDADPPVDVSEYIDYGLSGRIEKLPPRDHTSLIAFVRDWQSIVVLDPGYEAVFWERRNTQWIEPSFSGPSGFVVTGRPIFTACWQHARSGRWLVLIPSLLSSPIVAGGSNVIVAGHQDPDRPAEALLAVGLAGEGLPPLLVESWSVLRGSPVSRQTSSSCFGGSPFDSLGFCTWNTFGTDVSAAAIVEEVKSFHTSEIPVRVVLVDDGWQDTTADRRLVSLEANSARFPHGLCSLVEELRFNGVDSVGVWHAIVGYWDGIEPGSELARKYTCRRVATKSGSLKWIIDPTSLSAFYSDFYARLKSLGIAFVKVDYQNVFDELEDGSELCRLYQDVLIQAARKYQLSVIWCMCHTPEILHHTFLPGHTLGIDNTLRNSEDYFPDDFSSQQWHIVTNIFNSLLFDSIMPSEHSTRLDWDMFRTADAFGYSEVQALARFMSAGPIFMSDKSRVHNADVLKCMHRNGKLVSLRHSGLPMTRLSLGLAGISNGLVTIQTQRPDGQLMSMLAVFNLADTPQLAGITVDDIFDDTVDVSDASPSPKVFAARGFDDKRTVLVSAQRPLSVLVPPRQAVVIAISPVISLQQRPLDLASLRGTRSPNSQLDPLSLPLGALLCFGFVDQLVGNDPIRGLSVRMLDAPASEATELLVELETRDSGTLMLWCHGAGTRIHSVAVGRSPDAEMVSHMDPNPFWKSEIEALAWPEHITGVSVYIDLAKAGLDSHLGNSAKVHLRMIYSAAS
ncbi:glycoside hydrolase superfamily [Polychytrium aggregatum]|uniref:glycoside hydrolase superfamily n=1 Tax=Polychytrium aggregatum TaxID=110093 RepID=UPI0022FE2697|nr:glycoside hydrolase superfamily [Polychytrium aggregatum]KAI9193656.1 glycoside hydrolase superfamily [Polychytrium aggregatum]